MQISVNVTRADIVKMQFLLLFKLPMYRYAYSFYLVIIGLINYSIIEKSGWFSWAISSAILSFGILLAVVVLCTIWQQFVITQEKGYIGTHTFIIEPLGFRETTASTETYTEWRGIEATYSTAKFIFVKINALRVHIIPKRGFASPAAANEFYVRLASKTAG